MEQATPLLTVEEAAEFAGVNVPTIQRYTEAGFLKPAETVNEEPLYAEKDLVQVFELSPKRASALRKAATQKKNTKKFTVLTEKDRLIAEKDIQIRDLKDQREWLRARVEKLEEELRQSQENGTLIAPGDTTEEGNTSASIEPGLESSPPISPAISPENKATREASSFGKILRYFGFLAPKHETSPAQTTKAPLACDPTSAEQNPENQEQPKSLPALTKADIGARPFRRSRGTSSDEFLDLLGSGTTNLDKKKNAG
jgi:DNA-binding transcriptional MerR regulator